MKKLVYGIALNDLGITRKDRQDKTYKLRVYRVWQNMLNRCYRPDKKTYYGICKVCSRWLTFSNFMEDIKNLQGYSLWLNNPNTYICLDKDILGRHHAYYSPNYCMFTTIRINTQEAINRNGLPKGLLRRHKNELD